MNMTSLIFQFDRDNADTFERLRLIIVPHFAYQLIYIMCVCAVIDKTMTRKHSIHHFETQKKQLHIKQVCKQTVRATIAPQVVIFYLMIEA